MDIINLFKNIMQNFNFKQPQSQFENKVSNQSLGYPETFIDATNKQQNLNQNTSQNFDSNFKSNFQISNLLPLLNSFNSGNSEIFSKLLSNFNQDSNSNNIISSLSNFLKPQQKKEQDTIPVHKSVDECEIE